MSQPTPGPGEFRESPHHARWTRDEPPQTLRERMHLGFLTARGWGLFATGALALAGAWLLGRRELMAVALFLLLTPLLAAFLLRFARSPVAVARTFNPAAAVTDSAQRVRLRISHRGRAQGILTLSDTLPSDFGPGPEFSYPSRTAVIHDGLSSSLYEYRLRLASRGIYPIGPLKARFTDPCGLATRPATLDTPSALVAMPQIQSLESGSLPGDLGSHGQASSNRRATPDSFDVMTREYRDGDSIRRIHWPATARRGSIMVRQEYHRATPRALIVLDRSIAAFLPPGAGFDTALAIPQFTSAPKQSSPRFEWAVQAALGIGAHLSHTGFGIEMIDHQARPIDQVSASGSEHGAETFEGCHAIEEMQRALAALGLEDQDSRRAAAAAPLLSGALTHRLRTHGDRLVLLLGNVSPAVADAWIDAAGARGKVSVLCVVHRPDQARPVTTRFRQAGWSAVAVSPTSSLAEAWNELGRQA